DVVARVGILDAGADHAQHLGSGGFRQFDEFLRPPRRIALAARMRQDEDGAIAFLLSVKHEWTRSCGNEPTSCGLTVAVSSACVGRSRSIRLVVQALMTVVAVADAHVATRHDRGNGVL